MFQGHPNRKRFLEIFSVCFGLFRFVLTKFCLFRLFRYLSETPKQTEKMFFDFAKQTEKQPKQIEFRFVSVRTEKKNLIVSRTPYARVGEKCAGNQPIGIYFHCYLANGENATWRVSRLQPFLIRREQPLYSI